MGSKKSRYHVNVIKQEEKILEFDCFDFRFFENEQKYICLDPVNIITFIKGKEPIKLGSMPDAVIDKNRGYSVDIKNL